MHDLRSCVCGTGFCVCRHPAVPAAQAERCLRRDYFGTGRKDEWTNMPNDEKDALIVQNKWTGGRGRKRALVTEAETVSIKDSMNINTLLPFMNQRQFNRYAGSSNCHHRVSMCEVM